MPLTLPTTLGPYLLEAKLGEGGMAEVFRARAFGASGFEKVVVIKTLRDELIGEPQYERMFLEEARLQAQVNHGNLVQAHDLGIADGRPYVRLDFIDGADLATLLARHRPSARVAVFIAGELAKGLEALHRATDEAGRALGLVHRDVSARNVLVSRRGEVKLGDFGIAKATLLRETTRAGVRKGTQAYMSPEQLAGRALTAASDQFSLGVVLFELLTGSRPSEAITVAHDGPLDPDETRRQALGERIIEGPHKDALLTMLEREPAKRFNSMRTVFEALSPHAGTAFELSDLFI